MDTLSLNPLLGWEAERQDSSREEALRKPFLFSCDCVGALTQEPELSHVEDMGGPVTSSPRPRQAGVSKKTLSRAVMSSLSPKETGLAEPRAAGHGERLPGGGAGNIKNTRIPRPQAGPQTESEPLASATSSVKWAQTPFPD